MNWEQIENQVQITDIARRYGMSWANAASTRQINCPFPDHVDEDPSARYYAQSNSVYCHGCQRAAGPIGLVAAREAITWGQAAHLVCRWYGIDWRPDGTDEDVSWMLKVLDEVPEARAEDMPALRRAVSNCARMVGKPFDPHLLAAYDTLDFTDLSPYAWLDEVQ